MGDHVIGGEAPSQIEGPMAATPQLSAIMQAAGRRRVNTMLSHVEQRKRVLFGTISMGAMVKPRMVGKTAFNIERTVNQICFDKCRTQGQCLLIGCTKEAEARKNA